MGRSIKIATTWWANAWLEALKGVDAENRLSRGRSYFAGGHVVSAEFSARTLAVDAVVAGSAALPYEVSIGLSPMAPGDVRRLCDALAADPVFLAGLLDGRLDPVASDIATRLGVPLFPTSWKSMQMRCSCPDSSVPCKHLAAVYYAMVRTIDEDPMWVFRFRGVDLAAEMASRGVDLKGARRLADPGCGSLLALEPPSGIAAPEQEGWEGVPLYAVPDLSSILPELAAGDGQLREGLRKTIRRLAKRAAAALLAPAGNAWIDQMSPKGHPAGLSLVMDPVPRLVLAGRSKGSGEGIVDALACTSMALAQDLPDSVWVARRFVQAALVLAREAACVPVLAGCGKECTVLWLPAVQHRAAAAVAAALAPLAQGPLFDKFPEATPYGRAVSLLAAILTAFVHEGASAADIRSAPALAMLASPAKIPADAASVLRPLREALRPLSPLRATLPFVPVMTVRSGREDDVTVNLGACEPDSRAGSRPALLRDILAGKAFSRDRYAILTVFEMLARVCPQAAQVLAGQGRPAHIAREALREFLFEIVPALELLGARVYLPKSLQRLLTPHLAAHVGGARSGGMLSRESLAEFSWKIAIGDRELTREEFEALAARAGEVVRLGDDFVYLDPAAIERIRSALEQKRPPGYAERLRGVLTGEMRGATVISDGTVLENLKKMGEERPVALPQGLHAQLRPYQERGYAWLMKNLRLGLGALLADDMGLGKTLQVIAAVLALAEAGELAQAGILAVVPATLMDNWEREIARFAPALRVARYHGPARALPAPGDCDVLLTTYGTLRRDVQQLASVRYRLMILDEAQAIKNLDAAVSQAVRGMPARQVIAMSGTPVENRLLEYYSLLDAVQPGLLGTPKEFTQAFAAPIENDHDPKAAEAFRRLCAPFMLRRLKTDPAVIADLPERIVSDVYSSLLPEQAALYEKVLREGLEGIAAKAGKAGESEPDAANKSEEAARRRMRIMALMGALKQVCNSPSQYLGTPSERPDSAKAGLLLDLLARCREAHRKVLIFTQYRQMGERLQDWIGQALGERPAFLHGGVPVSDRMAMVDAIQNDPSVHMLVISLKAGGTGLNLTAASAVIHYDLWWNPAAESQATDRAYRIGQKRDVIVYRLVCQGTFEEKINEMLEAKKELAQAAVTAGEHWIGDLSERQLRELFALRSR